ARRVVRLRSALAAITALAGLSDPLAFFFLEAWGLITPSSASATRRAVSTVSSPARKYTRATWVNWARERRELIAVASWPRALRMTSARAVPAEGSGNRMERAAF